MIKNNLPVQKSDTVPYRVIVVFVLLTAGIAFAGYLSYEDQKDHIKKKIDDELSAVAGLKVGQIESWRKERMRDAEDILGNKLILYDIEEFINNPGKSGNKQDILGWMALLRELNNQYKRIILFDAKGNTLLPDDEVIPDEHHLRELVLETVRTKKIRFTDLNREDSMNEIHIDLVIPVISPKKNLNSVIGAVVLYIDPYQFLYPLIQSWPRPSATAETLLVRRDGEEVVYINELRHKKNTALSLRLPSAKEELPAAMAVAGVEGIVEGTDYRGKRVLAALSRIPGSPWFMVAKVDAEEVYTPIQERARIIAGMIGILIIATAVSIGFWWRQQNLLYYRNRYETERAYGV